MEIEDGDIKASVQLRAPTTLVVGILPRCLKQGRITRYDREGIVLMCSVAPRECFIGHLLAICVIAGRAPVVEKMCGVLMAP